MSMSMQSPSNVWILYWYNFRDGTSDWIFHYSLTFHVPLAADPDGSNYHAWDCKCKECARMSVFYYRDEICTSSQSHWKTLVTIMSQECVCVQSLSLFPVWFERLKTKTLDRWLEEDVKEVLEVPMPRGILRIIASYALEPVVPAGAKEDKKPPIYLDSDKLVDLRIPDSTCESKTCTCKKNKVNPLLA